MNHPGTQELKTGRLLLRRYTAQDAAAMYRNWASDAAVTRYLPWQPHESPAATARLLEDWCARYAEPDYFHWVIQLQATGEAVGDIAVCGLDRPNESASVGYCLGRTWWGQGIMTEAFAAVLAFLFEEAGLACVSACFDPRNPASGRVMQKCGLRHRCTLPAAGQNNQGVCDEVWYAMTKSEYAAQKAPAGQTGAARTTARANPAGTAGNTAACPAKTGTATGADT